MSATGRSRIYWFPSSLLLFLLAVFSLISWYLDSQQSLARTSNAKVVAQQVANSLEVFSADRQRALNDLLVTWPAFDPNPVDWFNAHASTMREVLPGFDDIIWVDQEGLIRWNIKAKDREQLIHRPMQELGIAVSPSEERFQSQIKLGSDGNYYTFIARAISPQEKRYGYVIASFDVRATLLVMVGELIGLEYSFTMTDGDALLLSSGEMQDDNTIIQQPVSFAQRDWVLTLQNQEGGITVGKLIFSVGSSMSLILCFLLYRSLRSAFNHSLTQIRYQAASESSLDAILIYQVIDEKPTSKADFLMVEANQVAKQIFATNDENLLDAPLSKLTNVLGIPELMSSICQVYQSETAYDSYVEIKSDAISPEWLKVQAVRAGQGIALTLRDVTARFEADQKLRSSEEKFRRLVDGLNGHFIYTQNSDWQVEFVSGSVREILGYDPAYYRVHREKLIQRMPDNIAEIKCQLEDGKRIEPFQIEIFSKRGELKVIECRESPLLNLDGKFIGVEGIARDVTQDITLQKQVYYQANHDQLTGLFNRYAFDRQLKLLLSQIKQDQRHAVLCFIDMDQFKLVNDSCGHPAGDELLRQVSKILSSGLADEDIVARVGGDEFCLVFSNNRIDDAKPRLDKLLRAIGDYRFSWDDKIFYIGASIGVVEINANSVSAPELIKAADDGCYQAKTQGKNRYFIYDGEDQKVSYKQSELDMVNQIQKALETDNFELFQQPIVAIGRPDEGMHYEILLRMPDDSGAYVSPAIFIPIAERYGLMNKIDSWVFNHTLKLLEAHPEHVEGLSKCAINLSGLTIGDEAMLEKLAERLRSTSVPPEKICFEITETTAVINLASASSFIDTLRSIGAKFALDDFGAGMSSFTYLKNMSVDYVKIDGSFVRNMCQDKIDYATVKAIHEIASSMGKLTVAEFVSDTQIKDKLVELGVSYGQGFGLGKPEPLKHLLGQS